MPPAPNRPGEGIFDEGGIFGQFAQSLQQGVGVYGEAGRALLGWTQTMLAGSLARVAAVLLEGDDCSVENLDADENPHPCAHRGLFRCSFCKHSACEAHAFVGCDGSSLCVTCARKINVGDGKGKGRTEPRPRPAPRPVQSEAEMHRAALAKAFGVLGVRPGAPWAEVRSSYKRLVAQWHPDQYQGPMSKEAVAKHFQGLVEAYALLSAEREKAKS